MIDSLLPCLPRAEPFEKTMREAGASDNFLTRACSGYAVATLHRPSNRRSCDTWPPPPRFGGNLKPVAHRLPRASENSASRRAIGGAGCNRWSRCAPDAADGLPLDDRTDAQRAARHDRFRRHAGRNHRSRRALSHFAYLDRAPDPHHSRHEYLGRYPAGCGRLGGTRHSGDWRKGRPYPTAMGWQGRQEDRCRSRHSISVKTSQAAPQPLYATPEGPFKSLSAALLPTARRQRQTE